MLGMDVFNNDAFSATSMTAAVDKMAYVPGTLAAIPGLVTPVPVRTTSIFIETRANAPALIQTTARGTPPKQKGVDSPRDARGYKTLRLGLSSRIDAEQLQSVRAFGSETELQTLQLETGRRQMRMKQDFALTRENWLLNMVQGFVKDADGTTLYNWATEFGQTVQTEIAFNFAGAAVGDIRKKSNAIKRSTVKALQGLGGSGIKIVALCGDDFFDAFVTSPEVRQSYLNWQSAQELRNDVGAAWSEFTFGGITWVNYRGTDDGSTLTIAADKAKIFPVNAGIFQWALSPAERFEFVNTMGLDMYSWVVRDMQRDMWADVEMYTYPLPVCVMPGALGSARAGT